MVGSRRTWNTDEPGLGRPKALPSSAPCMASVIWMVLSGRHMPVSVHWLNTQRLEVFYTVTQPHATSGKSPTLPQCRSFYTPLSSKHPPHPPTHPPFPIPVFISPPVPSPHDYVFLLWSHHAPNRTRPLSQMYVLLDALCVYRGLGVCLCVRVRHGLKHDTIMQHGAWVWIYCLSSVFVCPSVCTDDRACQGPICCPHWVLLVVSPFCPVLKADGTCTRFSSAVNTYWAVHEREMTASS